MWLRLTAVGRVACCHREWLVSVVSCIIYKMSMAAGKECDIRLRVSCCPLCRSSRLPHPFSNICKPHCSRQGRSCSWRSWSWRTCNQGMFPEQSIGWWRSSTGWAHQVDRWRSQSLPMYLGSPYWCNGVCRSWSAVYCWAQDETWFTLEVRYLHC